MPDLTPDGRYLIVRGRLWRRSNPSLPEAERERLVSELMDARRGVAAAQRAGDAVALKAARAAVHQAKVALGERGPVWWADGSPDYNRHLVKNTPYALQMRPS
jgi:predicted exporter